MRYAIRSLAKAPGFSAAVILTLALAIGANTAVFSVLRGVLLRPLPHRNGASLVYLRQSARQAGQDNVNFSVPEIIDYRTQVTSLTGFAELSAMAFNMIGAGEPVEVQTGIVSGNYFDVMGLRAEVGRTINAQDDGPSAAPVMMLTDGYWRRAFGADPSVIGKVVRMNGRSVTIIGVAEAAPPFPKETEIFVNIVTSPHHLEATMVHGRSHRMTEVFARLQPGVTIERAQSEVDAIAARIHRDHPEAYDAAAGYQISVTPLRDALTAGARRTLYLLTATAALVLLTACANVANLVLTRNMRRDREITVRWALGADRWRLRRFLLSESAILAVTGAALGIVVAYAGLDLLVGFAARFTARATEIRIDGVVLTFALITASAAALVFALTPVLRVEEAAASLSRLGARATGSGRGIQRGLIVAQIAATFTVLTAAGLLARTLMRLYAVETGVHLENTLTLQAPIAPGSSSFEQQLTVQEETERRMAALPGVTAVGVGANVPLRASGVELEVRAEGHENPPGTPMPRAEYRTATPQYFRAGGIPLLAGREFASTDTKQTASVAILNEVLAKRLFPNEDAVGRRVTWTGDVLRSIGVPERWLTVVGVVGNTRDAGPNEPVPPALFQPLAQNYMGWFPGAFVIRGQAAATLVPQATRIIRDLTPDQPIIHVATLAQIREETVAPQRLNALLVGALGLLALAIATIGIGGVLAFFVSQRTSEIGIRMGLGALPSQVMRMVLADGAKLLGIGIAFGLLASIVVGRLLQGLLFGVAPQDPTTLATVSMLMAAVGLAACSIPALRAARVDPLVAIRTE